MQNMRNIERIFKKLKPVFGEKIEQLYLNYLLANSREEQYQIEKVIHAMYQKYLNHSLLSDDILLEPPKADQVEGEYPLGRVQYAKDALYTCALREKDWVRHACITGMSGSGKTNFALQIVGNFIFRKKPFLVFDWKKSFRPLLMLNKNILCFTIGNKNIANFKVNINQPPTGVPPKEWINLLCDLITESFSASYGVHKVLRETLNILFDQFGVYDGSQNYPTWFQVKDRLEKKAVAGRKGRETEWVESALRIAEALTFGNFGESVNAKGDNMLVEELFEKQVLFEMNSLNNYEKKFFCEFILTYIYKFKKINEDEAKNQFNYAIVVDEAHNIFLKDKTSFVKESVTEVIYREIREYGVGLICLDQHISKLSDVVIGNSACHVAFQQQLPADLSTVANLMNMYEEKDLFTRIPVGQAVVKLAERYHNPFLISVPLVGIKDVNVPDEKVKERTRTLVKNDKRLHIFYDQVKTDKLAKKVAGVKDAFHDSGVKVTDKFAKEQLKQKEKIQAKMQQAIDEWEGKKKAMIKNHLQEYMHDEAMVLFNKKYDASEVRKYFKRMGFKLADIQPAVKMAKYTYDKNLQHEKNILEESRFSKLTTTERQFLHLVQKNPTLGTAQIYHLLHLSTRKGTQIKNKLIDLGFLETEELPTRNTKKHTMRISVE